MAAYETPVSDRMWHLTATASTPPHILQTLLHHLADGDGWDTQLDTPITVHTILDAAEPLTAARWTYAIDGPVISWTNPTSTAGARFDTYAVQHPQATPTAWSIWAAPSAPHDAWTITASPHAPSSLIATLADSLTHTNDASQPHGQTRDTWLDRAIAPTRPPRPTAPPGHLR